MMTSSFKPRMTSIPVDTMSRNLLKKHGEKGESYSSIIKRVLNQESMLKIKPGILKQLDAIAEKTSLDSPTLIEFGIVLVIILMNSGALQQLQSMASKNHTLLKLITSFMKK